DVYDALTTPRVYKPAFDHQTALNMILNGECGQFSPLLLQCLQNVGREFDDTAAMYRDGMSTRVDQFVSAPHKSGKVAKNRSNQASIYKYFAMLQMGGDIVFELNLDSGEHHLVYPLVVVGSIIRENGKFFDEMEAAASLVHPDDREALRGNLAEWQRRVGSGILTPEPADFRIYVAKEDSYHWYRITFKKVIGDIDGAGYAIVKMQDFGTASALSKNAAEIFARVAMLEYADGRQTAAADGIDRAVEFTGYFGDGFAEYDLLNNVGTYYYDGRKSVFPLKKGKDYLAGFVHRDDLKLYKEHLTRLLMGNEVEDIRFRMDAGHGEYRQKWKRSVLLRDKGGNPIKAVSSVTDADRLLSHMDDVKMKSQIDQMTGSLNKTMAEYSVSQALSKSAEGERHTLILIDIDDFKLINDTFGHLMGDEAIRAVSRRLSALFAGNVVGRMGGDEFMVFIKNCGGEEEITRHLQSIYHSLGELRLKNNVAISTSCGVARYPMDGADYTGLFENADKALYKAKLSGKARFCFAEEGEDTRPAPKTRIESETAMDKDFYNMLGQMLLDMDDYKESVESVFNFVARNMSLSSVVATGVGDNVLYEWRADTSYKPYCRMCEALTKLNYTVGVETKDGVISCADVDNLDPIIAATFKEEGVGSFMAAATGDDLLKAGHIVFATKEKERVWRHEEQKAVRLIVRMLSLLRAKTLAEIQSRDAQQLIDTLFSVNGGYNYVIDETYRIIRADSTTKKEFPGCEGEYCYGMFNNQSSPCSGCPAALLNSETVETSANINLRKFGGKMKVTALSPGSEQDKKLTIVSVRKE
ncbi:MAG: diguanylate cyclase, partial [Firmicutes bacterium]|nr:diguanylate cyclase [Bacillota bacterium]